MDNGGVRVFNNHLQTNSEEFICHDQSKATEAATPDDGKRNSKVVEHESSFQSVIK